MKQKAMLDKLELQTVADLRKEIEMLKRQVALREQENVNLRRKVGELEGYRQLAFVDTLTGAFNRRYFDRRLASEINRARRELRPLSLLLVDVNQMKQVNDQFGHQAGDDLLKRVTRRVQGNLRSHDILCRIGGDEFAILLTATNADQAKRLAKRLQTMAIRGSWGRGGISVGVGTLANVFDTPDTLFARADAALYRQKAKRRPQNSRDAA